MVGAHGISNPGILILADQASNVGLRKPLPGDLYTGGSARISR